jgi:aspartokinase
MSLPQSSEPSRPLHFERERGITAVRAQTGTAHVDVRLPGTDIEAKRLELLLAIADAGIPVFLIKLHPGAISFAMQDDAIAAAIERLLVERGNLYSIEHDLAILSISAGAMRDLSGVMAGLYDAMDSENIRVAQTVDAYDAVFCLVPGVDAERGAAALRATFGLTGGAAPQGGVSC